jgi:hypothetical protein
MFYIEENEVVHKRMYNTGRTSGTKNNTEEDRVNIGALARLIGPTEAAELTGVCQASATSYARGQNGTSVPTSPQLLEAIDNRVRRVHDAALEKLLDTIDIIDVDRIADEKPKVQADIAKSLSSVVKDTGIKPEGSTIGQVIIYSPKIRDISEYPEIKA